MESIEKMKITAGMGTIGDYETLVKAGASEVFAGFVPEDWNLTYGNVLPLNRREVLFYHVQITTYSDMKILKRMVDRYGVPVAITFNALYYTEEQIERIIGYIRTLGNIGFHEFIIADVNLLRHLRNQDIPVKVHVSGEIGEWNVPMLTLLKEELTGTRVRISRLIFHRKTSIDSMKEIVEEARRIGLCEEAEAFLMNEKCHYTGGYCSSLHADEMVHLCMLPYRAASTNVSPDEGTDHDFEEQTEYLPGESGCGLCALRRLSEAGITHLKIVGRGASADCMEVDIRAAKEALKLLSEASDLSEEQFRSEILSQIFSGHCSGNCYYTM